MMAYETHVPSQLRVGVIGPTELVARVQTTAAGHKAVQLVTAAYEDEQTAPDLFDRLQTHVDSVLFTGPVPYDLSTSAHEALVPTTYVAPRSTGLYRALFLARERHDLTAVTVDTVPRADVQEAYAELELPSEGVLCLEYQGGINRREIVDFHVRYLREGRAKVALTCLHSAYLALMEKGVPCFWVTPTASDLRDGLDRAVLLGESARSRKGQAVICFIRLIGEDTAGSEYAVMRIRHDVHGELLRFAAEFDGHLLFSGGGEYQIFSTREAFERSAFHLGRTNIVERLQRLVGHGTVSMGIGYGRTANQAGTHGRIALVKAQEAGHGKVYALLEDRRLVGPLQTEAPEVEELRTLDPGLLEIANQAGVSGAALGRLIARLGGGTFTATDIVAALDVSLRTAHRLLAQLEKAGGVRVVGQEKLRAPGRPRQVFRFAVKRDRDAGPTAPP